MLLNNRTLKITMEALQELRNNLEKASFASAWKRGVNVYAFELVDTIEEHLKYNKLDFIEVDKTGLRTLVLNGADNFKHYSWSGCSFAYNYDIAKTLCTPSELKKCREGEWRLHGEEWLDKQARALTQAFNRVYLRLRHIQN